jgi:hypothetical protein
MENGATSLLDGSLFLNSSTWIHTNAGILMLVASLLVAFVLFLISLFLLHRKGLVCPQRRNRHLNSPHIPSHHHILQGMGGGVEAAMVKAPPHHTHFQDAIPLTLGRMPSGPNQQQILGSKSHQFLHSQSAATSIAVSPQGTPTSSEAALLHDHVIEQAHDFAKTNAHSNLSREHHVGQRGSGGSRFGTLVS